MHQNIRRRSLINQAHPLAQIRAGPRIEIRRIRNPDRPTILLLLLICLPLLLALLPSGVLALRRRVRILRFTRGRRGGRFGLLALWRGEVGVG